LQKIAATAAEIAVINLLPAPLRPSASYRRGAGARDWTGEHWTDALLHRIRSEILLKRDPANTAPAEEALLAVVAHCAGAKGPKLRTASGADASETLSIDRSRAEAHAVFAPRSKALRPPPEMPEIVEAKALLERS
jgi:hypothetical protein